MARQEFIDAFTVTLGAIRGAEDVTKRELKPLSRTLLSALHGTVDALVTGDIQFINETLAVLSPVNRRVAVLFFKHFSGFHYGEDLGIFTKKNQKTYADAKAAAEKAMEDPLFNIFTWSETKVEIEAKPFDPEKVTTFLKNAIKKAQKDNKPRSDVLRAVFGAGFTVVEVSQMMNLMAAEAEALDAVRHAQQGQGA